MGYRSTVIFGVNAKNKEGLQKVLKKNDLDLAGDTTDVNDVFIVRFDHVKWYDGYSDVSEINNFIENCHCDGDEDAFMVGLGEDNEIHNEIGSWYDFVSHQSYLEID